MKRSGPFGMISNRFRMIPGIVRAVVAQSPEIRYMVQTDGAASTLTFASAISGPNLVDVGPGDNTTFYAQAVAINQTAWVAGIYDLKTAQTITRVRWRYGTVNGNNYISAATYIEASNDGVNWVNAYTGGPPATDVGSGVFAWAPERDVNAITATAYRYWRVVVQDVYSLGNSDARLGDFRLYTAAGLVL